MPRNYKSVAFTKRHYEMIAEDLRITRAVTKNEPGLKALDDLADNLISTFAGDNGNFRREQFKEAAHYGHRRTPSINT